MSLNFKDIIFLFEKDDFTEAIDLLNKHSSENKSNVFYYFYRGIAYYKLNKFNEAKKDFNYGISINKNLPEIYNNLAILNYSIGENEEAIENFLKTLKINNKFTDAFIGLTNSLSHTKNYEKNDSNIINIHKQLNKISFDYLPDKIIENESIKIYLKKINDILDTNFNDINFNITQTYRRDKPPLICDRHKKIFYKYSAIPKFCFSCYKVQIDIDNVVDLIKLYIVFDNIMLPNINIRKCMIETRSNITGKYKGLILSSSIEDAEIIKANIEEILNKNIKKFSCKIKRGCTEYGLKYSNYNNLTDNAMKYNPEWKKHEDLIDKKSPELSFEKKTRPTVKGLSLYDALVIRNWLVYARLIGDKSYEKVTNQIFYSKPIENTLKKNNLINI